MADNENKKYFFYQCLFSSAMLLIGCGMLLIPMCKGHSEKQASRIDTVIVLGKPISTTYNFTTPAIYKEKTIEYHTYSSEPLTRADSDLIVLDYLKQREYRDSSWNDTSKVIYRAVVSKNRLDSINFKHTYKPKVYNITKTVYRKSFNLGAAPGYNNGITAGIYGEFETNDYTYGLLYDPLRNPKGGYFTITKRFKFKK